MPVFDKRMPTQILEGTLDLPIGFRAGLDEKSASHSTLFSPPHPPTNATWQAGSSAEALSALSLSDDMTLNVSRNNKQTALDRESLKPDFPVQPVSDSESMSDLSLDMGVIRRRRSWLESSECEVVSKRDKLAHFEQQCSKILEFLYLGGDLVARSRIALTSAGITHVLNCVGYVCPEYFPDDFTYKTLWLEDNTSEDITCVLYDVFDFIEEVRRRNGRVYVHCSHGVSRSASLVIAYLVWFQTTTFEDALRQVRSIRGVACPNMGFACQLLQWQKRVLPSSTLQLLASSSVRSGGLLAGISAAYSSSRKVRGEVDSPALPASSPFAFSPSLPAVTPGGGSRGGAAAAGADAWGASATALVTKRSDVSNPYGTPHPGNKQTWPPPRSSAGGGLSLNGGRELNGFASVFAGDKQQQQQPHRQQHDQQPIEDQAADKGGWKGDGRREVTPRGGGNKQAWPVSYPGSNKVRLQAAVQGITLPTLASPRDGSSGLTAVPAFMSAGGEAKRAWPSAERRMDNPYGTPHPGGKKQQWPLAAAHAEPAMTASSAAAPVASALADASAGGAGALALASSFALELPTNDFLATSGGKKTNSSSSSISSSRSSASSVSSEEVQFSAAPLTDIDADMEGGIKVSFSPAPLLVTRSSIGAIQSSAAPVSADVIEGHGSKGKVQFSAAAMDDDITINHSSRPAGLPSSEFPCRDASDFTAGIAVQHCTAPDTITTTIATTTTGTSSLLLPKPAAALFRMAPQSPHDPFHLVPKHVPCASASLDPRGAFLLQLGPNVWCWQGAECPSAMMLQAEKAAEQVVRYERLKGLVRKTRQGEEPAQFAHALAPLESLLTTSSSSSSSSNSSSLPSASSSLASSASESPSNTTKSCLMETPSEQEQREGTPLRSQQLDDQKVRLRGGLDPGSASAKGVLAVLASAPLASLHPSPICDEVRVVDGVKGKEPLPCTADPPDLEISPTASKPRHDGFTADGCEPMNTSVAFDGASGTLSFDAVEVGDLPMLEICATGRECSLEPLVHSRTKAWDIRDVSVGSEQDCDVAVASDDASPGGNEEAAIALSVTCRSEYDCDYDLFERVLTGKGIGLPTRCASDTMAGRHVRGRGWLEGSKSQIIGSSR